MSIENVRADLARYGLADRIREFDTSSATVAEAAAAIGCEERQIAKTLSLYVGTDPTVIVVAGDARIVNAKYKAQFHTKPRMIPAGEVEAAALPGTLLALGEASNCKLVADDTKGDNLSQSVMVVRGEVLGNVATAQCLETLKGIWDDAAKMINDDPEAYREVLIENANLPVEIADTYPISTYPTVQLPTAAMVDPVLAWMEKKGYLTKSLTYDESTGEFSAK